MLLFGDQKLDVHVKHYAMLQLQLILILLHVSFPSPHPTYLFHMLRLRTIKMTIHLDKAVHDVPDGEKSCRQKQRRPQ